jgi:hypothetical protein
MPLDSIRSFPLLALPVREFTDDFFIEANFTIERSGLTLEICELFSSTTPFDHHLSLLGWRKQLPGLLNLAQFTEKHSFIDMGSLTWTLGVSINSKAASFPPLPGL